MLIDVTGLNWVSPPDNTEAIELSLKHEAIRALEQNPDLSIEVLASSICGVRVRCGREPAYSRRSLRLVRLSHYRPQSVWPALAGAYR